MSINGYKTYGAAALLALFAVLGGLTGQLESEQVVTLLLEAGAIAGLRHSVAKLDN